MADRIVEEHVVTSDGGSGAGMTLIAFVLGALVILAILYFTGTFNRLLGGNDTKIEVDINKPSAVLVLR
jgi:hypothetical protein